LEQLPADQISDDLLVRLWAEVDKLHRAGIAHRSMRAANVMVTGASQPRIVDFSFSELAATARQMDLDVAELLASLATLAGEDRAVSAAAGVLGARGVAPSVPLLQPLALSAATRRAIAGHDGLLALTRSKAADASGHPAPELARVQRVRPRTLLAIAAAVGAYYYMLPQLAHVGSSWRALQSAHWIWLPVVIACSVLTYLASAIAMLGSALVTLAYIAGLAASTEAFGAGAGIAALGAVYLGASVIATASPTPGGVDAFEAALITGLTGIGISSGAAVAAVIAYRLATYWLPVVPGWLSLRLLQRKGYV